MSARVLRVAILLTLYAMTAGGCASVSISTPDGMVIETRTLWKDIEAAEAQTENMVLSLGTSTSSDDAKTMLALCLLLPDAEGCP
jgi:hypothetical protein